MKKRTKLILVCAALLIVGGIAGLVLRSRYLYYRTGYHGGKYRLYYETDYYALREACMKVIANRHSYRKMGYGKPGGTGPIILQPDDPSLPPVLLEFNLSALVVTESRLAGHPYHGPSCCSHYGFAVFLDENNITDTNVSAEEMDILIGMMSNCDQNLLLVPNDKVWVKIIDNLWFFDPDTFPHGASGSSRDEAIQIFRKQVAEQEERRARE